MAKRFYYQVMGETFGPMSGVELRDRAMAGDVTADTLVRINEDGNWVLAARLKNLFDERGRPITHSAILGPAAKPPPIPPGGEEIPVADSAHVKAEATSDQSQPLGGTAEFPSDGIDFRPEATEANTVSELPDVPAVYALYGGRGKDVYVAYVGMTDDLRDRIEQHLIRHEGRVTGTKSAVSLNPDSVTEVRWWTHPAFLDPPRMRAALAVAWDVLQPVLRGEALIGDQARQLYNDPAFAASMMELIKERPAGHFVVRTLDDAWDQIDSHEKRLAELERKLAQLEQGPAAEQ